MSSVRRVIHRVSRVGMMTIVFSATALGVVGCGGGSSDAPRGGTLTGGAWELASYLADTSQVQVPDTVTSTAVFSDGKVGGNAGVNQYGGTYKTGSGGTISFGDISSTLIAGPPDATAVENAVFAGLKAAASYYADAETLTLYDKDDNALLVYGKAEKTSLVGVEWLVTNYNNGTEAIVSVSGGVDLTALFDESGKVSGFSGVNTYNGDYSLDGSAIEVGPLATTRMAGDPALMEQETLYLTALQSAAKVIIVGDKCELHRDDGAIAVKLIRK